ncbi:MAG: fatty acid desaturase [Chloroherpetonaceae bacterium]|nr:fatty acid desaturase [Chloroherpetonaceae bacterium]
MTNAYPLPPRPAFLGSAIGLLIIFLWCTHLAYLFTTFEPSNRQGAFILTAFFHLALQGWLTTGLFITAHDAMHGTVSRIKWLNHLIGAVASFLYAAMSYPMLRRNHFKHHEGPATPEDPDFNAASQNFFVWFGSFIWRYKTWSQIILMALLYNFFERVLGISEITIWLFWVIPSLWGSLQLFYFGTYLPHRLPLEPQMQPHRARSQAKNHLWSFFSCYFFGYHWEHHESPRTEWWRLWELKNLSLPKAQAK